MGIIALRVAGRPPCDPRIAAEKSLAYTGEHMAELFGVAGGPQWRKYTGGITPREMSPQMLFFGAARLVLTDDEFGRVLEKMREIGATIEVERT